MYRTAASRIRYLKERPFNKGLNRFASSTSSPLGGLFGWLVGDRSKSLPLDFPLPGVSLPSSLPDFVEPDQAKITTLPNVVKIASETTVNPAASIGLYVDSGSVYETPESFGATHLLERMAFKTTKNRSHLHFVREVEAIGGNVQASASREQTGYTFNEKQMKRNMNILRPLSPHLPIYKPQLTSTFSIFNRISGAILTTIVFSFYLLYLKMGLICFTYDNFYGFFFYSSKLNLISVEIAALALSYHLYHGLSHLWKDALKTNVPAMVGLLVNRVRNPVFLHWEANEQERPFNKGLNRFASSTSSPLGGLFGWLVGDRSKSLPLDFPLPGVSLPSSLPDFVEPGKTKITTLPNGVKIASETTVNPVASIGLYVDSGSVYETPESFGATHLLERMAFKTTQNRSHLRVVREVEAIGGNVQASASREQMGYTFDALKTCVPAMVELLVDCVRNPVFLDWEVNEQLQKIKAEISEVSNNPHGLILEAIHAAGYSGALGNPLIAPESSVNRLNSTLLEEFVAHNFTASRIVLAASGVDHQELLSIAEPLLSDLPSVPHPGKPKSVYTGGDYRHQSYSGDGKTHFALAFELPGGWRKDKEAMALTVLQMLLGGGGSFSAGGPGKGMYSRLYLRVLNEHPQVLSISAFSNIYDDTSIFGIQATTGSDFVSKAIDIAAKELIEVGTTGEVDQLQLDRAKQATKSAILMNLESRMVASEDVGRQILTYGERKPVDHFLKAVDEVTLKDILSIARMLFSSPLTMASYGDVVNVPSYDSVSSKFRSK